MSRPAARARPPRPRVVWAAFAAALVLTVGFGVWAALLARHDRRVVLPPRVALAPDALHGLTVVVDPGHGGADRGAELDARQQAGRTISEAALTYRTAAELAAVVHAAGGTARFTVRSAALANRLGEGADEPDLVAPIDAVPADGGRVVLGDGDDPERLYVRADAAARVWRGSRPLVVFLSLHYDARPDRDHRGAVVLVDARQSPRPVCASVVAQRLRAHGLGGAVLERELGVLNPARNPVPERLLVELATLTNEADRRAALSAAWRWRVVRILAAALADCRPRAA